MALGFIRQHDTVAHLILAQPVERGIGFTHRVLFYRYCQVNPKSAKVTPVCRYRVVIISNMVYATLANYV